MKITLYIYFLTDCSSFFHVHFFLCLKRHISFSLLLWLIYKQCRWCYAFATFVLCSLVIGSHCLGRVSFSNSCLVCVLVTSCFFFFHFGKNPKGHPPPPHPPPPLFFSTILHRGVHPTNVKTSFLCWESRAIKSSLFWATVRSEYNHFQAVYQLPGIPALCISVRSSSDFPCCLQI